jgi:hypothetical protein
LSIRADYGPAPVTRTDGVHDGGPRKALAISDDAVLDGAVGLDRAVGLLAAWNVRTRLTGSVQATELL